MLVLSRYCDESIYIGDDIVVTIVDIRGDRVRLGIQAPPHVSVHRKEVYDAIARERQTFDEEEAAKDTKPTKTAPLERQLAARRGKGLPVEIEASGIGFGGMAEIAQ